MFTALNVDRFTVLSLVELEDAEEIFSLVDASRNYLREWLPWVDSNTTSKDTEEFIRYAQEQYVSRNGFHCSIRYKGQIAGVIGFHRIDWANKTAELAYWLGEQYQGMGLMTKCCRVLTEYAFIQLKLYRVEILANNLKSCAVAERLGFTKEKTLTNVEQIGDRFVDNIVYSIAKRD